MPKRDENPRSYDAATPWTDAVRLFGEDSVRAQARTKQTRSTWRTRGVPAHVMMRLLKERVRTLQTLPLTPVPETHTIREWQETKMYTAACEMLWRLIQRNQPAILNAVGRLLEAMVGWADEDWERLHRMRVDHLVARLREEAKL